MLGFAASEFAAGYLHYRATNAAPKRYRNASFWSLFTLLGAVVGLLIVAIAPDKSLHAVALGSSMPLIIHRARRPGGANIRERRP